MIQLTEICYDLDGNPYEKTINVPDTILVKDEPSSRIGGGNSIIIVPGAGKYVVKETREEVARKVLEWQTAYRKNDIDALYRLAGLKTTWEEKADKVIGGLIEKLGLEEQA